ncbi:hypothetical protein BHE74_00007469 [Ensete ventricosum]|nr:hypothetical protein BHE74_00007469 [Ensete ventricosum]
MQFNSSENPREKKGSGHSLLQVDDHSKPSRTKTSPTRWGTNQTLRTGATFKTHLARQGVAAPRRVTGSDGADDEDPVASERIAVSEELLPSRRLEGDRRVFRSIEEWEREPKPIAGGCKWALLFSIYLVLRRFRGAAVADSGSGNAVFRAKFRYHDN